MVFQEINWRLDFISERLDFDLVPVKNHRLLRSVCFYAKHSSLFDLQSDLFRVFTAEITKVRSRIGFYAAGGSVAKNILTTFYSGIESALATISSVPAEFLQQSQYRRQVPELIRQISHLCLYRSQPVMAFRRAPRQGRGGSD
jgi:hypothetical protein